MVGLPSKTSTGAMLRFLARVSLIRRDNLQYSDLISSNGFLNESSFFTDEEVGGMTDREREEGKREVGATALEQKKSSKRGLVALNNNHHLGMSALPKGTESSDNTNRLPAC